jgi:hypothetical protein
LRRGRWTRIGVFRPPVSRTLASGDRLGAEPVPGCRRRLPSLAVRWPPAEVALGLRLTGARALAALPGPLMARRRRRRATRTVVSTVRRGRCCGRPVLRVLRHRRGATQVPLLGDLRCRTLALRTLNQSFSVSPDLRTRSGAASRPRHHGRRRILPTSDLGTRSDLDVVGWRTCSAWARFTLDLDLRSNLALGPCAALSSRVRRAAGRRPLVGLRLATRVDPFASLVVPAGALGTRLASLASLLGRPPTGLAGRAVAGDGVLRRVRPGGIGRFWAIRSEAARTGGGIGRSVHACSLVWPPGGRRAQPIGAGALPRRLSTTWAAPIPPAAAEG